jgi:hypothetical protein
VFTVVQPGGRVAAVQKPGAPESVENTANLAVALVIAMPAIASTKAQAVNNNCFFIMMILVTMITYRYFTGNGNPVFVLSIITT